MIRLVQPFIGQEEILAVSKVMQSGWLAAGKKVTEFEERFAEYIGVKYAVAVNSCASALQLAMEGSVLGRGKVIVPSFTFVASANAIVKAGLEPKFIDINYNDCNMQVSLLESMIDDDVVAIMPVHYAGGSCDMQTIMNIAKRYNLTVIEDSAEAIGAEIYSQKTGSFGIGCFSFFPTKNMTCGEGGMITTNDEGLKDFIKALSSHGISKRKMKDKFYNREATRFGYNMRMSDIVAAIGIEQLKKLPKMNRMRREHAFFLNDKLKKYQEFDLPYENANNYNVYQMYTIKINDDKISRDNLVNMLRLNGIEASVHFEPLVHKQKIFKKYVSSKDNLEISNLVSSRIFTIPLYPQLNKTQLCYIVKTIIKACRTCKNSET